MAGQFSYSLEDDPVGCPFNSHDMARCQGFQLITHPPSKCCPLVVVKNPRLWLNNFATFADRHNQFGIESTDNVRRMCRDDLLILSILQQPSQAALAAGMEVDFRLVDRNDICAI